MSNEGFLRRWSRLKSQGEPAAPAPVTAGASMQYARDEPAPDLPPLAQTAPHPPFAPPPPDSAGRTLPTIDDVATLGPDSDFSAFVSQGVDKTVQRLAMKKLFSDPHFNIMDGLDIYIDDYNKADPIPAAMLASLEHAKSVFARFVDDKQDKQDKQDGQGGAAGDGAGPPQPGGQASDAPTPPHQPEPPQQDDA